LASGIAALGAGVLAFYIPFSPLAQDGQLFAFIGTISQKIGNWAGGRLAGVVPIALPPAINEVIGQLASGLMLCVLFEVLVSLLLKVLANAVVLSDENPVIRFLDGACGILLGVAICAVVIVGCMFVLLVLEAKGWYLAGETLFVGTDLFKVCYESVSSLLGPIVEKVVAALPF
jgi:hypothetical protein